MDKMLSQDLSLYKPYPEKTKQGYRPSPGKDVLYFLFSVTKQQRYKRSEKLFGYLLFVVRLKTE